MCAASAVVNKITARVSATEPKILPSSSTIRIVGMLEGVSLTGPAKVLLQFAERAHRRNSGAPHINVSIVLFVRGTTENHLATAARSLGVPVDIIHEGYRFDVGVIPQLRAVVHSRAPDVIWSNSVKSHFLVRWAGLNQSCCWIASHHGYTTTDLKMRLYNQFDRWSLPAANRVLTVCNSFVHDLRRQGVPSDRIGVHHNPIGTFVAVSEDKKRDLRRQLGLDGRTKVLLTIGRLSPEKGHIHLVKAFSEMHRRLGLKDLRLIIVGDGQERARIERMCVRCKVVDAVALVGHQRDVNPYFAISDVFVLPSHSEGSPNALLEAMMAEVPVVATAVGGVPEIVTHGREALLVRKNDVSGLARAIRDVLDNEALRRAMICTAREAASRRTPEDYFQSLSSVFRAALQH